MRTFSITVNGKAYNVQAEETTGAVVSAVPAPAPVAAAAPVVIPVPVAAPAPVAPPPAPPIPAAQASIAKGEPVRAPMPGTIVKVQVEAGQTVKKHDVLVVLEAMKMENEIVASRSGVVAQVAVSKGASVNTDDVLVVLQ
ncbi:biotin carboxyl carrier protein [Clostridia bacterium]|nr:biotin carboxyl carrier protein [Clostridia bacterium]